jgi:hypothetical protein
MVTALPAGIGKPFYCEEQPSDLTLRNWLTITDPQAYGHALSNSIIQNILW